MIRAQMPRLVVMGLFALLGGCATRPINPPVIHVDPSSGYRFEARQARDGGLADMRRNIGCSAKLSCRFPKRAKTAFV